uniref:Ig-like domain-containing protein n=1 Tax=Sparus aurata TaxID=8175 RepID=A0A671TND1_SPAAU
MFFLYKRVSHPTGLLKSHRFKPLLGSSSGTERDFIIHGQTHTAEFLCNAERGDPGYWYSVHSSSKFAWSSDIHLSPSLTVSPDSAQHFTSDSVSLSCEGNSTEWTVRRSSPEERYQFDCTWWGTLNGSTCNINTDRTSDAVYWCESGSGELSNAVNITIQGGDMILLSPARPVTEGHSVSLSCKSRNQTFDSIVFFYHNEKVIQSDIRWELNISAVSKSDEGFYKCQHSGRESAQSWMSVQANGPKAELRADYRDILVGGSVNLTCSVNPSSSSGWKYFWYRGEKTSEPLTSQLSAGPIRVSEGGVYWCRGGRGEPVNYTEYSDSVTINKIIPNKAVVTLQPNWTEVYVGERITLRCEIKDGGDTEWEYEWRTTSSEKPSDQNEHSITSVTGSHSGDYRCKGRKKHTQHSSTHWSDPIKLTVSDKPQPVITVSPSWLSAGASVTLNCRVKDPSAGWRFYWYKMVPHPSDYRYEQLPGSSSGTEQDSYIVHGQTHTAGYRCRAGRGDPVYSSYSSYSKFVWSADIHSSASLTVSPDRDQKFTSDSVSLSCEGNSAGWRVMRFSTEDKYWSACSTWGTMTGSTCNINTDWPSDAVYWCESGSGEFTNAVNITVQDGDMILLSPARPVTEGDSVSLSCKLRSQTFDSIVFFYHNEKVIQNDSRWELNISAVSKSDEGFYKCQHSGRESAQSWMSVQANRPKAELRADDRDIPVGGSVTLTCSVNPSSSGWKYFWYKGEKTSEPLTSQLSAGPIRVSEGGVYWCRGGRGEPVNYTEYSDSVTIYKIIPNKAFVTLQPNWTEVYRGERITLRCEIKDGGDTEWEYEWRTTSSEKPSDENEHSITSVTGSHSGDYRCKGTKKHTQHSATDWSDPIKLTVSDSKSHHISFKVKIIQLIKACFCSYHV